MKFSFIIPCYNTAKYLNECLESIFQQTYQDWEIILVNDGSTDHTEEIIRSYAEKDNRIRAFNQENQGVSETRNRAVEKVTGDYLIFVDSDDWYKDEECLEHIAKALSQGSADILVFRYQIMWDKGNISGTECLRYFATMKGRMYTGEEYLQNVLSRESVYQWFPWLYVFKTEFWRESRIKFDKELWVLEDVDVIYKVILRAQKVGILDRVVYQYRQREGSAARMISRRSIHDRLNVCKRNIDIVNCMDITDNLKRLLNSNFACTYFDILTKVNFLEKSDRRDIFYMLKDNYYLANYAIRNRNVFIRKITCIFGLRITSKLLFMRYKWKQKTVT